MTRKAPALVLKDLDVWVVGNPPPHFGGRYFVFLRLTTACGIEGVGEVYTATFGPEVVRAMIRDVFEMHFEGSDPFDIERLWHSVYGRGYTLRPDVSLVSVLSGLETACWDIVGKALGKPVHALLGGRVHDRLRTYTYIYPGPDQDASVYHDVDATVERALHYVSQGFTALKFDPAGPYSIWDGRQPSLAELARSEAFVKALRSAVGDRADLLFGTHGQFTPGGALRMARRIAPHDPLWFEEPVPPDSWASLREICRTSPVPVATGERLTTAHEFAAALECGVSVVQPALGRAGGISQGRKIAALAEVRHAQVAPHLYCGPVEALANIQLAASLPNLLVVEMIGRMDGFHAELLDHPIRMEGGHVVPSERPGLGHEVNETVARAHPWPAQGPGPDGDERLHLEMQDEPVDYGGETRFAGG